MGFSLVLRRVLIKGDSSKNSSKEVETNLTTNKNAETLKERREISDLEGVVSGGVAIHRFVADLASEGLVEIEGTFTVEYDDDVVVDFPSPRIEWREEIRRFAGVCGLFSGNGDNCNSMPSQS